MVYGLRYEVYFVLFFFSFHLATRREKQFCYSLVFFDI